MALHPEEQKRHVPDELPVGWNLTRRHPYENEDWYRDLVEHSDDMLCVHDLQGRLLSMNPVPARLLGYSVSELLGIPIRDLIDPQFRSNFDDYLLEIERTGEAHGVMAVMTRTGEQRFWEYSNTLRAQGMEAPVVRGIAHDVTERVRVEKALRASNKKLIEMARAQEQTLQGLKLFRTLLDQSNDAIEVIDPETLRFVDVNERACISLGYSREELLSMAVFDIDPIIDENALAGLQRALEESGLATLETLHRRKDGTTFPVEVAIRWVQLDREYGVGVSRDITERKRAEETLRQSEARERARATELETILEAVPIPVVIAHDAQCRHMTANRMGREYLRLKPGANASMSAPVGEKPHLQFLRDGVEIPVDQLPVQQAAATGLPVYDVSTTVVFDDGTERHQFANAAPLLDEDGMVRGAVGAAIDITERKRAEEALRASEERLRLAQEAAGIGMFERDLQTGDNHWSPEMEAIYGLDPGSYPRTLEKFLELVHPEDRDQVSRWLRESMDSGEAQGEWRAVWPDKTVHWISGRWRVFKDACGKPERMIGMDFDITRRKETEEELRQSEERFRVALKHSPITVFNQDRDLRYTWMYNSKFRPADEYLGKTPKECFGPGEGERLMEVRRRVLETGVGAHHELHLTEGDHKGYFDMTVEPVLDSSGAVIGLTGARMDVTSLRETAEALREAKEKLTEEKLYLEHEIDTELGFGEIVGQSGSLQEIMRLADTVASSDATVLLLGETGTGKELVARAIHRLSRRSNNTFIKLNCAAIPYGLLESELFGSEKGSFTGSVNRKPGRLELSDEGTLFLDEIGEIALDLQPKLLRVLQDHEFERLGGTQTLKVNFRLIAATNRDLAKCVREGEFRSDLYYRLNVFPIRVPPLRERRDDIQLLVEHFVQKCTRRMNKSITSIPKKTMDALREWEWPGNIRELENFIERSVILTRGSVLVAPLSELRAVIPDGPATDDTLEAAEREHILHVIRESHGQIGGPRGAAKRLGMKRTTLQSKLKRLGIRTRREPTDH